MGEIYDGRRELAEFAGFVADADRDPVVVVAGCGTASTVTKLREYGVEAYGFDASRSVLDAVEGPTRKRVLEADLRDDDLVASLCEAFEIDGIDVLVTECMLSFLSVDEAATALGRIRDDVGAVLHRTRIDAPVAAQEGEIEATVLSPEEWRAACDPDGADVWRDAMERWDLPPHDAENVEES